MTDVPPACRRVLSPWLGFFVYAIAATFASANVTLIPAGSAWRYLDNGSNQGTGWRAVGFNDSGWSSGPAELGYGDGDEATVVSYGPSTTNRYITTYFRKTFTVADPAAFTSLKLRLLRDDGAVVYLNGTEVRRENMPTGTVSSTTLASTALGVPAEATYFDSTLPTSALIAGTNTIAVELHQANATSSDISFNLELIGVDTVSVTRGPYLQQGTPTSVIVRWRTDTATDSRVSFGTAPDLLETAIVDSAVTTEHQVQLTGLEPDTQYFYAIGSSTATHGSGPDFTFYTAPPVGTAQPTRVWVLGDSGTANAAVAQVRDAYTNFTGTRYTDLWLMLGDNAYETGTDAEYQAAVFNMFPTTLRQSVLWPTIGNHDTASSTNPPLTIPYFQMFNLPTNGEAGGLPSGTEKYYSFDFANIHFICLDSMTSSRTANGAMATWLQNDLGNTTQEWIIAYFHHPPYSKGSHDSDVDVESIEMRSRLNPILEAGGVDLVLSGHSHSYERSFLLDGHYGLSNTLTAAMKKDAGSGRESGPGATGPYEKPSLNAANQGAVYITAGSSGKISGGALNHPAMYISFNNLGSLVLDVDGPRLDLKYLRETGAIDDFFTVLKTIPNEPPTAAISSPAEGAAFTAPADISVSAAASDSDGQVVQVDFYANAALLGTRTTAPFSVDWTNVAAGSYGLTATATDDKGATVTSTPVNITVMNPPPPSTPAGLSATGGNAQVALAWQESATATSYKIKRATAAGGPHILIASDVIGTNFTDTSVNNGTTYYYVVVAHNLGGDSANSNEASARPLPPPPLAPTGLSASGGDAQVALSWSASTGATSYTIHRATVSGGPYGLVAANVPATTYSDGSVTNGVTYFYVVTASNLGGESGPSSEASATPTAPANPPAAPAGLTAAAGNAQVALSWEAANGATSYSVKRATVSGGPYATVNSGLATTNYTDTSVSNGTLYFYVVTASNSAGESANSNEASAQPSAPPTLPAAPTNLVATAVSRTQINLQWMDNTNNETGYRIERSTSIGSGFSQIGTVGANVTTFSSTGLKSNRVYYYRVRATNAVGQSPYSNTASARTFK